MFFNMGNNGVNNKLNRHIDQNINMYMARRYAINKKNRMKITELYCFAYQLGLLTGCPITTFVFNSQYFRSIRNYGFFNNCFPKDYHFGYQRPYLFSLYFFTNSAQADGVYFDSTISCISDH